MWGISRLSRHWEERFSSNMARLLPLNCRLWKQKSDYNSALWFTYTTLLIKLNRFLFMFSLLLLLTLRETKYYFGLSTIYSSIRIFDRFSIILARPEILFFLAKFSLFFWLKYIYFIGNKCFTSDRQTNIGL